MLPENEGLLQANTNEYTHGRMPHAQIYWVMAAHVHPRNDWWYVPQLLDFMKLVMEEEKDFYNIVGARVYSEILAVKVRDLRWFHFARLIDGEFVGFC